MKKRILFAAMIAAISAPAVAGTGVNVHVSTLGYGGDVAFQMTDTVDVRVGLNQFKKSINKSSSGLDYAGDLKLSSFGLLADWHLFNGVTHLTAGLMGNGNKLSMTATAAANTNYTINGATYNSGPTGGTLTTAVDFNKTAPYLGFGWSGQPKNSGFSFNSDFGIMFQGSPKATVTAAGWSGAGSALTSDAQTQLNEDLKNYKYYPVISIGIGYAF
jgi:hypothetical protein